MKKITALLLLCISASLMYSDVPERREQLIYSIMAFNGKDYAGTFSGEDSKILYLIADIDNFLTIRKTLVYFWPITQDLKTDTESLNISFSGTIEITGLREKSRIIEMIDYTYYNVMGEYELNWKVDTGEDAEKAYKHYTDLVNAYWKSAEEYRQKRAIFDMIMNEMTKKITEMRKEGKDFSKLLEELKSLEPPSEPSIPRDYIVPPAPVQKAFILNLPVGEYSIRFFNTDGTIMEGSERKVVTFKKRREQGIGLEVIPGDKWTRPVESKTPSSVLYVDGTTDLYIRPYFQNEYNDLYYEKMIKNDSKGNPNLMKWVRIQQVPKARIELTGLDRSTEIILESPFIVKQAKGAALGYSIVPYDVEGAHKDKDPDLMVFHVPIKQIGKVIRLKVQDKNGTCLTGGDRQIRIVSGSKLELLLILFSLLPLLVMMIVLSKRAKKYMH